MKGYLYIAKSEVSGRYYIGSTNSVERRVSEHNSGKTVSLQGHLPIKILFIKEFNNLLEARKIELKLKKMKSRVILEAIVRDQEIKMGL